MTSNQHTYLFAELWPAFCRAANLPRNDRAVRLKILSQMLGREIKSSDEVNSMEDFDRIKSEILAVTQPANLDGQMETQNQPLKRRRWAIRKLLRQNGERYLLALVRSPRFALTSLADLETMNEEVFKQFRSTANNRASAKQKAEIQPEQTEETENSITMLSPVQTDD